MKTAPGFPPAFSLSFLASFLNQRENSPGALPSGKTFRRFVAGALKQGEVTACAILDSTGKVIASAGCFKYTPEFSSQSVARRDARYLHCAAPIGKCEQPIGCLAAEISSADAKLREEFRSFIDISACLLCQAFDVAKPLPQEQAGLIGPSFALRKVREQIAIVAPAHTTVLLQGESGTGKELVARAIHSAGPAPGGPFISLNCAALPESLIESELFGHERGAFTGAAKMRRGRFELANGGTLFLDEIGELGPGMQAKLLRALQERSFERLGGMNTVSFDARIIAATNRDLAQMVEAGAFRRDLFYRLNVFAIHIPPLRERPDDIIPLAALFLARHSHSVAFSSQAVELLQMHSWPGNVRELQNAMERAALLLGNGPTLWPEHLPPEVQARAFRATKFARLDLKKEMAEFEAARIDNALAASGGRVNHAAAMLGLTCRELGLRLDKYGISYKDYRKKK